MGDAPIRRAGRNNTRARACTPVAPEARTTSYDASVSGVKHLPYHTKFPLLVGYGDSSRARKTVAHHGHTL